MSYSVTYNPNEAAGSRIVDLTLDNGTVLVANGEPTGALETISVATIDFMMRGGDGYPFDGVDFTVLPVTYQQAFETYLVDDLGGTVLAEEYPVGGEGRTTALPWHPILVHRMAAAAADNRERGGSDANFRHPACTTSAANLRLAPLSRARNDLLDSPASGWFTRPSWVLHHV